MKEIKLSLSENARDFLAESLSYALASEDAPGKWKYAILNLIQAVELTLKEALREEHFSLVFADPGRMQNTVTIDQVIQRLTAISKIEFTKEELDILNRAKAWRNEIIHFEFSINEKQLKSIYAALLAFLSFFYSKHLEASIEWEVDKDLWEEARSLFKYRKKILEVAESKLKQFGAKCSELWLCRHCGNKYFEPGERICYACGHSEETQRCENCRCYVYVNELSFVESEYGGMKHCCSNCAALFDSREFGTFSNKNG